MMNRFRGLIVGCIAVLGAVFVLLPTPAQACTCLTPPSPSQGAEAVDVVFVGTVANVEHIEADGWLYGAWKSMLGFEHLYEFETLRVTMDVNTAIKGTDKSQLILETSATTELCGVLFQEGEEYLVYAFNGVGETVTTDMCTRTATSKKAAADIKSLVSNEVTAVCEGWTCIND
ncbi:MAG: hypothetical protein OXC18_09290 [Desulfurellaceae bacterium]|nr:hypothetical protein [Desulfurellaceae bacterium]